MQKAVEIESRGLTLRGMVHIPDGNTGKLPVVIIFHGFTGHKMESHFSFVKLSRLLEKSGIASVRFDFGGSGESDGDFVDMTISKELLDAKTILDYVKTLDYVDINRIGVVGLSMGGAVASMLAGDRKEDICALCLWAPAGNMLELILNGPYKDKIAEIEQNGYIDLGGLLLGLDFINDLKSIDIYEKASSYDKNVLILHGDSDKTVPVSASEKFLEIYEKRGCLHIVQGGDHTFNSKVWEDEVLDYTMEFMADELK